MEFKDISIEELELLSYADIAYILIKQKKVSINTPTIFKLICDLLEYSEEQYFEGIGDFYTSLTIDKRFLLLDNNEWDLREKHSINLFADDDMDDDFFDDEEELEEELEEEIEETEIEEDIDDVDDDMDDDEDIDELDELTIIDDDDLED